MIEKFNQVMNSIKNTSKEITQKSMTMSDNAKTLAEGSTNQASSVQNVLATIEQISSNVTENAKHANEVSEHTNQVKSKLELEHMQMNLLTEKMEELTTSSTEINNIVTLIESISKQTNLLSLNASIEASRSGANGKGFSVLADEISNLAHRSNEAVKSTRNLIQNNLYAIYKSNQVVEQMKDINNEVLKSIHLITELSKDLALSSDEQANAIRHFNKSMETITYVIQENADLSVTMENSGREMAEFSEEFRIQMSEFTTKSFV